MFEPSRCIPATLFRAALIVALAAPYAGGQTVAEYTRRVDSLAQLWRAALATQTKIDSGQAHHLPGDTVREGNFTIISEPAYVALARRAAALASPKLDRAFGASAAGFRQHALVLRLRNRARALRDSTEIESGVVNQLGDVYMLSSDIPDADALAARWQRMAEEYITKDLGPTIRDWLGASIPSDPASGRVIADGRVNLVLSNSKAAHDCAVGDLPRCIQALGLAPVDDPAFTLYDEDQRRQLLERNAFALRGADEAKYARCSVQKLEATCDSLVHTIPFDAVPTPVSAAVRQNFIRYALMVGGDGAFDRLVQSTGTVNERIAVAARIPTDSVVRGWQATLMSSRLSSTAIDATTALSSLLWAAACGALALRSSRWR